MGGNYFITAGSDRAAVGYCEKELFVSGISGCVGLKLFTARDDFCESAVFVAVKV